MNVSSWRDKQTQIKQTCVSIRTAMVVLKPFDQTKRFLPCLPYLPFGRTQRVLATAKIWIPLSPDEFWILILCSRPAMPWNLPMSIGCCPHLMLTATSGPARHSNNSSSVHTRLYNHLSVCVCNQKMFRSQNSHNMDGRHAGVVKREKLKKKISKGKECDERRCRCAKR